MDGHHDGDLGCGCCHALRRSTISSSVLRLPSDRFRIPAAYGLLAALLTAITMIPSLRPAGWSLTVLPRVSAGTAMGAAARSVDPGFRVVKQGAYDGEFYWGIAVDPVARGNVHDSFDVPSYRYGHPLLGWLGWVLSAGQARYAAAALAALGIASMLAAGAAAAALGLVRGRSGVEALFVALNPGLLYAAAHDLTEPLSAALLLGAFYGYMRNRQALLLACLVLLPLSKEVFIVVPLALAAWELIRRGSRIADVVPLVATLIPAAAWWVYARLTLGAWFTSGGDSALGFPLAGWGRSLVDSGIHSLANDAAQNQLGEVTVVLVVSLLGLLTVAGLSALRLRGPVDLVYLLMAAIAACLVPAATTLPRDALRNAAVLVVLVPFVIVSPSLAPTWRARRAERREEPEPQPS